MALKPCIVCGLPSSGSRCPAHTYRNGSTRTWRKVRVLILARLNLYVCQLCGRPGSQVDHIVPLAEGGDDAPGNLRTLCNCCHALRHWRTDRRAQNMSDVMAATAGK